MGGIKITLDDNGKLQIASDFDPATTYVLLSKAHAAVLAQVPAPQTGVRPATPAEAEQANALLRRDNGRGG